MVQELMQYCIVTKSQVQRLQLERVSVEDGFYLNFVADHMKRR